MAVKKLCIDQDEVYNILVPFVHTDKVQVQIVPFYWGRRRGNSRRFIIPMTPFVARILVQFLQE